MLTFFRKHVSAKLATIWLVIAIPLSLVLLLTYYEWYSARLVSVTQERRSVAQGSSTAFQLLVEQMRFSLRATGVDVVDFGTGSRPSAVALKRLVATYPVANASLADTSGRIVASSDPALVGSSVSTDAAFRSAISKPPSYGLEPSEVASGGVVGFHVAQQLSARPGKLPSVMLMFVDVRKLARVFPIKPLTGGTSVLDSAGQVVYQSESAEFAERRAPWGRQFPFIRPALHGHTVVYQGWRFPLGGTRIVVFVPMPGGMAAGSSVAPSVALAPFYRTLAVGVPIAIAIGIVALYISIVISRGIHRSLDDLAEDARRIGAGDLGRPVGIVREDEIGEVAGSLEAARAELLEARQRAERELATTTQLLRASRALSEHVALPEVLATLTDILLDATSHSRSFVFFWDEDRRAATRAASAGEQPFPPGTEFGFDELSRTTRGAIEQRRGVIVDFDALPVEQRGRALAAQGSHLMAGVPIVWAGRLIGLIGVDDPGERKEFSERELDVIEGIAAQAAVAIENARLFGEQARGREAAETLDEINGLIHASLQPGEAMQRVLELTGRTLGASGAGLFTDQGGQSVARYQYGLPEDFESARHGSELFPFGRESQETQEPVVVRGSRLAETIDASIIERFGIRTLLAIPLIAKGRVVGGISLVFAESCDFSPVELDFGRKVGATISLAIENAGLYESSRRELARTTVLRDVATAASSLSMGEVAGRVLETVRDLLGARSGIVYRLDEERQALMMVALRGYTPEVERHFTEVPLDDASVSGRAVLRDRLLTFRYDELPDATRARAQMVGESGNGWLAVPAHAHGEVIGAITLVFDAERRLDEDDLALFRSLGDQLGVELENARLFEAESERARLGRSMIEINADLASSLEIDETLPRVIRKACEGVGALGASVVDRIEGGWVIRDLVGISVPALREGSVFRDDEAAGLVRLMRSGMPEIVEDVMLSDVANREIASRAGYRSYVAYPLVVRGEVTGALTVFFAEARRFSDQEIDYLRRVAFAVSLGEENSRLYGEEHRIAETLQTALLALPERIPGIEFAHLYHSATEAARVGGDFYDLFELEHDKVGITVGDISGHGVDAAVLTSLVKNAIRVRATQQDSPPNEVMRTASELLYANSPTEIFATVFFGVLRLDDGMLEYCNAGHTTGACICADGGVTRLEGNSPLIGAFATQDFEISAERVEPGDLLFLYTDGLTEARRDHELFGEKRLFDLLRDERGGDPDRTMRTVMDEVMAFAHGRLSDDLAILAVQRDMDG